MNFNVIADFIAELSYQAFELYEIAGQGWYGMGVVNLVWIFVGFAFFLYWTKELGRFQKEEAAQ